jgi:RimJ/RimL family protein N-acetyltransferase
MSDGPVIRGNAVVLRPVEEADLALIHRWMNHPEVWHYMDYERPVSLADVTEDVERSRAEGQPFTIVVDGRPIGRIGLNQFHTRDRICGFYMYIGEPAFWGKGYAQDAVVALPGFAFDRWDLNQVELWTLGDNDRALATYKRCGFVEEARLRDRSWKDGRWVDHVMMSVNRDEFERTRDGWLGRPEGTAGEPQAR